MITSKGLFFTRIAFRVIILARGFVCQNSLVTLMDINPVMAEVATGAPVHNGEDQVFPVAFHPEIFTFAEVEVDQQLLFLRSSAMTLAANAPSPLEIAKVTYDWRENEEPEYREVRALLRCVFHGLPRHMVNPPIALSRNMNKFVVRYAKTSP